MRTLEYRIRGMDCAHEVAALKKEVGPVVGGEERLGFDLLSGKMTVRIEGAPASGDAVRRAVARTGMRAEPWEDRREGDLADGERTARRWRGAALLGSGAAALVGGSLDARPVLLAGVVLGLLFVAPRAAAAARRFRPDMNLLMTIAVLGAVVIGETVEAATVAFLFALSLWLEGWSIGRARRAVAALLDLSPPRARVLEGGGEREVGVEEVAPGTSILVRPHERIPLDGTVVSGVSSVDQAPLTGESVPVDREAGDEVFAGTINGDGALTVRTLRPARDTVLARMVRRVAEAQGRRAPVERWVDRFARLYTPVVMGLALATLLGPPLLLGAAWGPWIYRGLVLLVIACPCALVISTPVSLVAALAAAARHGVLIKGAAFLERAAEIRAVALDKTGTVTRGRLAVASVESTSELSPAEVLALAAALESRSGHPLAQAVVAHARAGGGIVVPAEQVREIRGSGVRGTVDGREAWAGSARMNGGEEPASSGRTAILVGDARGVLGRIELTDELRPEAPEAVRRMREAGVAHVVLLTGDREGAARMVAEACGIAEVRAGLLPEEKVEAVERLIAEYGATAVVGDGVNDAPALARADLGIAMAAAGSDAAVETADVALVADDLRRVPWLFGHARRTLGIVRVNIAFALATKLVFALAAWAGYATLWAAIAADMGASLLVIANGLRLLGGGPERAERVR